MQKLIDSQFFCYPNNKNLSILYLDKRCLKTRLFKALSYQISSKDGFLLKFRKTNLGHYLSKLSRKDILEFKIPENKNLKIGYKNNDKIIFFEFDENDLPVKVLWKNKDSIFEESDFLGYSLIENYTTKEYYKKRDFIKLALEKRWQQILENKNLHGDFTHFNILISQEQNLHFIDAKKLNNSILFDHFYFYSYYCQCLEKCQTISSSEVAEIKSDLQGIIINICNLDVNKDNLDAINVNDAIGLTQFNREDKMKEFSNFLLKNEK